MTTELTETQDLSILRVLVIEDRLDSYVSLSRVLCYAGIKIDQIEFSTTGRGLRLLGKTQRTFDLVLVDLELPVEDGYAVLKQLRTVEAYAHALIVAVTGHVSTADMAAAQSAGFDGFIGKPVIAARFPQQLQRLLAGEAVWERM